MHGTMRTIHLGSRRSRSSRCSACVPVFQLVPRKSAELAALNLAHRPADQRRQEGPRYLFNQVWGDAILPDRLRWIWKDYPK